MERTTPIEYEIYFGTIFCAVVVVVPARRFGRLNSFYDFLDDEGFEILADLRIAEKLFPIIDAREIVSHAAVAHNSLWHFDCRFAQ